jgi:hypothetical protein
METIQSSSSASSGSNGARNTFLTVICILSFIGSGWGIIKAIGNYIKADTIAAIASDAIKNREEIMDQHPDAPGFIKRIMNSLTDNMSADNLRKNSIADLIGNLLTLLGAILMWNLNKLGFYIYTAGIVVLLIIPVLIFKYVGVFSATFTGFIGVIFIVMYGVNLKYMTK